MPDYVDDTGRLQTVERGGAPRNNRLLGGTLVVTTPHDAVECFVRTKGLLVRNRVARRPAAS